LVVFIDDLDRCVPEKAISVLEAVKLFLDAEGCVFVLGVDRDVIEKGIRVKYQSFLLGPEEQLTEEDLLRRIPITGRDYVEKIVQLPFSLPSLHYEQVRDFVESLLPDDLSGCASVFARGLEANPRKIKRGIHVFRMLRRLAELQEVPDLDPVLLAKMVILQSSYRGLYADILQEPSILTRLELFALGKGELPTLQEAGKSELGKQDALPRLLMMLEEKPHFGCLSKEQLTLYLYLTRTTSEGTGSLDTSRLEVASNEMQQPLLSVLLSNNRDWVQETVQRIQANKADQPYVQLLQERLGAMVLRPTARHSIGMALAMFGDPRDLDEMMQLPGQSSSIAKYLVTNGQFRRFVQAGGYTNHTYWSDNGWQWVLHSQVERPLSWDKPGWDADNQPVAGANWYEADAYCNWLSKQSGRVCRLPSVEEWLLAARGDNQWNYPWGDEFDAGSLDRANTAESNLGSTTAVGLYPSGASSCGALDMAGNVWEWTGTSGQAPNTWLLKGGSWREGADRARCQVDWASLPAFRDLGIGFRALCEGHQQ
jgi:formylglycine-generating enzyme required for sulfatase activity